MALLEGKEGAKAEEQSKLRKIREPIIPHTLHQKEYDHEYEELLVQFLEEAAP